MDLVAFLTARLDEDKALAEGALTEAGEVWEPVPTGRYQPAAWVQAVTHDQAWKVVGDVSTQQQARHIARHHPARTLAEAKAKRQLIKGHDPDWPRLRCPTCCGYDGNDNYGVERRPREAYPCRAVRSLALAYADHPDFDESWRDA